MNLAQLKKALLALAAANDDLDDILKQLMQLISDCRQQNQNHNDAYANVYNYSMALKSYLQANNRGMVTQSYATEVMEIFMPANSIQQIVNVATGANGFVVALPGIKNNEFTISFAAANAQKQILPAFYSGPLTSRQPCQQAWNEKIKGSNFALPTPQ